MSIGRQHLNLDSAEAVTGGGQQDRTAQMTEEAERKRLIEAAARKQLRQSSYPAVRDVQCSYERGVLTLQGQVPSYYLKQVAQTTVLDRLEGVVKVENQLVVDR